MYYMYNIYFCSMQTVVYMWFMFYTYISISIIQYTPCPNKIETNSNANLAFGATKSLEISCIYLNII